MENCSATHTFSIAHLYKEEKAMDMHIHDCYEIYYSISGGKQFLIDNRFYTIEPGDIFIINQYESHKITQVDKMVHERIVLSIHPDYTKRISTSETDLDACFSNRPTDFSHKISLNREQQKRFLYYINKITGADGTTINKYITARRISIAKSLLSDGVRESYPRFELPLLLSQSLPENVPD